MVEAGFVHEHDFKHMMYDIEYIDEAQAEDSIKNRKLRLKCKPKITIPWKASPNS